MSEDHEYLGGDNTKPVEKTSIRHSNSTNSSGKAENTEQTSCSGTSCSASNGGGNSIERIMNKSGGLDHNIHNQQQPQMSKELHHSTTSSNLLADSMEVDEEKMKGHHHQGQSHPPISSSTISEEEEYHSTNEIVPPFSSPVSSAADGLTRMDIEEKVNPRQMLLSTSNFNSFGNLMPLKNQSGASSTGSKTSSGTTTTTTSASNNNNNNNNNNTNNNNNNNNTLPSLSNYYDSSQFSSKMTTGFTTLMNNMNPIKNQHSGSLPSTNLLSTHFNENAGYTQSPPTPTSTTTTTTTQQQPSGSSLIPSPPGVTTSQLNNYYIPAPQNARERLKEFKQIRVIGTGTFGKVYLVQNLNDKQFYAMKCLSKANVVQLKQVEHLNSEKNILASVNHPFIVNLYQAFQDEVKLYLLFEYVAGGEVFTHLRKTGKFSNSIAKFYAAEIILALEFLHKQNIVYRDLKPENLLIDKDGHIKITDFGFAKRVEDRTFTLCGTPEYLAPEVIQSKGHGKAVDWWALGILIFEMLAGYPPFYDDDTFAIYNKILAGRITFPMGFDVDAKDLIKRLLTADRTRRLGALRDGAADVKNHRWFVDINWDDLYNRKFKGPFVPTVQFQGDSSNFEYYEEEPMVDDPLPSDYVDPYANLFQDF